MRRGEGCKAKLSLSSESRNRRFGVTRAEVAISSEQEDATDCDAAPSKLASSFKPWCLFGTLATGLEGGGLNPFVGAICLGTKEGSIEINLPLGLLLDGRELASAQPPNLVLIRPGEGGAACGATFF